VFEDWNKGELDSFLIEITKDILKFRDSDGECATSWLTCGCVGRFYWWLHGRRAGQALVLSMLPVLRNLEGK